MSNEKETIEITNLHDFITLLIRWHDTKMRLLQHLNTMPEGTQIEIEGVTEEFNGDLRRGFQLGITVAISELGQLPFAAEMDDSEPQDPSTSNGQGTH